MAHTPTPGPWNSVTWHTRYPTSELRIAGADNSFIATLTDCQEVEANACLIAAAPELLKACKWVLLQQALYAGKSIGLNGQDWKAFAKMAQAATRKAEGRD